MARAVEAAALSGPHSARPPFGGFDRLMVASVEVEAAAVEGGLAGVAEERRPDVLRAVVHDDEIMS